MNYNQEKVKKALNKLNDICIAAGCSMDECFDTCYVKFAENSLKIINNKTSEKKIKKN